MPRLRLFANLREMAGTASVDVPGASVGEVVDQACRDYGSDFAAGVDHARIWVNGDAADRATTVATGDEIALIPPVSGGAYVISVPAQTRVGLAAAALGALLLASTVSLEAFVITYVGVAALWAWDLGSFAKARGVPINIYPLFYAVIGPAWGAYRWGFLGFAFAALGTVVVTLVWGIFDAEHREFASIEVTILAGLAIAVGSGPAVLLRMRGTEEVTAYIVIAAAALAAGLISTTFKKELPFLDLPLAMFGGAVAAGAIAGTFWGVSWSSVFIGSILAGLGIVAGRTVGGLLRSGAILRTEAAPGYLALLDGPMVGIGMFWLGVALFA